MAGSVTEYFLGLQDGQTYDKVVLHGHLIHQFIEPEVFQVLGKCLEQKKSYEDDAHGFKADQILAEFQKFYNRKVTMRLIKEYQFEPEKLVDEIEKLQKMKFSSLPLDVLGDLDIDKVIAEDLGNIQYIPTSFDCVKESSQPYDGYSTGQVVMVCAPPGVGKTLFLAHEVVKMMKENNTRKPEEQFKVYWLALGDMNRLDFIVRLTAIYSGDSFNDVKMNPKAYFTDEIREAFRNVKISVVPAAHVDIYGVKYFIENSVVQPNFDPHVVIVDYDANLLSNRDTMYQTGEEVYNVASTISRPLGKPGRLVFVASQPKIEYWNQCPMPKEAAAESSRKQAIIDMMITIARDPRSARGSKVGKILVAKNRRGSDGCMSFFRMFDGHFVNIDENDYVTSLESSSAGGNTGGNTRKQRRDHNASTFGTY